MGKMSRALRLATLLSLALVATSLAAEFDDFIGALACLCLEQLVCENLGGCCLVQLMVYGELHALHATMLSSLSEIFRHLAILHCEIGAARRAKALKNCVVGMTPWLLIFPLCWQQPCETNHNVAVSSLDGVLPCKCAP